MAAPKFRVESGVQLLARLTKKADIKNFYPVLFEGGLKHGDTVELISNVNTSHILIDVICEALYPSKKNEESKGVLMFNTDGKLLYELLIRTLQQKICLSLDIKVGTDNAETDRILYSALKNLHIFEIYDATQFSVTIHTLDSIFMKHTNISLLLFNTLTAFYWSEHGFKTTKMDLYIKNLLEMIENVSKEYKVIIIYTRASSSKDTDNLRTIEVTDTLVNFKVQLVDNSKGSYQVNVKTVDSDYKKYFDIVENLIKWQK